MASMLVLHFAIGSGLQCRDEKRDPETWHQKSTEPTVRSIRSGLTRLDRHCPLVRGSILPTYLKKKIRQFDLVFRPWTHPLDHSIWHHVRPPMVRRHCKAVRDRSHAVQQLSQSRRRAPE